MVALLFESSKANLIGIDFGSSFIKATLVRPGKKFEIVENTAGGRKTPQMLTIDNENRQFGADSFLLMGKQPKTTFSEFQRVFGQKFDSDKISKMKTEKFITNDFVSDDRGLVGWKITVPGTGED